MEETGKPAHRIRDIILLIVILVCTLLIVLNTAAHLMD